MSLNSLYLFSNVRITPDYSVVHDMDPDTWRNFLLGQVNPMPPGADHDTVYVNTQKLNYYRMPDVIRIEGNYDVIRKATYGLLQDGMWNDQQPAKTSFKYVFFWVKNVRLITQRVNDHTEGTKTVFDDVVELELEMDTWSTYGIGAFSLYDSFVERRHMDRWVNNGTDLSPDWQPIYYPNAGQGVEGAYLPEDSQDATASLEFTGLTQTYTPTWIIISAIDQSGVLKTYIGGFLTNSLGNESSLYFGLSPNDKVFGWEEVVSGAIYAAIGLTADNIQSITCVSSLGNGYLDNFISWDSNQNKFVVSNIWGHANGLAWFEQGAANNLSGENSQTVNVIAPDHAHQIPNPDYDPSDPDSPQYLDDYDEEHEPMMYMSPARVRKVVSGTGGEVFTIPDVIAIEEPDHAVRHERKRPDDIEPLRSYRCDGGFDAADLQLGMEELRSDQQGRRRDRVQCEADAEPRERCRRHRFVRDHGRLRREHRGSHHGSHLRYRRYRCSDVRQCGGTESEAGHDQELTLQREVRRLRTRSLRQGTDRCLLHHTEDG